MAPKSLPWFKVQSKLIESRKFQSLSASMRGHLLTLWCIASDNYERGKLPDKRLCISCMAPGLKANPSRYNQVIDYLIANHWIDEHPNGDLYIHDWEQWQSKPNLSDQQNVENQQNVDAFSTNDSTNDQQNVDADVENKQVNLDFGLPRGIRGKNTGSLRSPAHERSVGSHRKKANADERWLPLREHITSEWQQWRSTSISSVTTAADWSQLSALLNRSKGDPACSLTALKTAWTKFAASKNAFDKKQGLKWFCTNIQAYLTNKADSLPIAHVKRSKPISTKELDDVAPRPWWEAMEEG